MLKNDDLEALNDLLKQDIIKETTILSQNIKKKTQRAVKVTEIGNRMRYLIIWKKRLNNMIYMRTY